MSGVSLEHLRALYARGDDPWDFRTSDYERWRFDTVLACLPRARFRSVLEIGCGNGELARRLASRCDTYTGLDAVDEALSSARSALPVGTFLKAFLPCRLPDGEFDLIVLSEILYFLDPEGLSDLADQIDTRWPQAELLCVNYRGPSGNLLEGEAALALFLASLDDRRRVETVRLDAAFRIETVSPAAGRPVTAA